ncbi:MAG: YraN family protein [Cellvibrionaceae bacterium]|nr:YraN family protein [Cellvibrionaceae bacterium]
MGLIKKTTPKKALGDRAENIACRYLRQQGLGYVTRNFSCKQGEIDLIFKDQATLVFVEVRYRKNAHFGHAQETITFKKQKKLIQAARYYLHTNRLTETIPCRFDSIGIELNTNNNITESGRDHDKPLTIHWIKNAFYAD